jgi:hypothetical protein
MIFILAFLTPTDSHTQAFERTYGGDDLDSGLSVEQTTDGGYIIAGSTQSFGAGGNDVYLIKTDSSGDTTWTRTYGGVEYDYANSVQQATDGGYIIVGYTESLGADSNDVYLIKTDPSGDTTWTRTYGGVDNVYDSGSSVRQTTDGGYIITGYTRSFGAGGPDVYLIKTDSSGDTTWTRTYGGADSDYGDAVRQTTDGGYIIAGKTKSFGAGGNDVYLIKTDSSGDTTWTRTYGGIENDYSSSVQQTTYGGYIVVGYTGSFGAGSNDVYLIKTDATGDTAWTRTYGGVDSDYCNSVWQTTDEGYIITGATESFGAGGRDVYLIRTDTSGDTTWTRIYGGVNDDWGRSVRQTTDGGYIIAGATESFGEGPRDVYLIKVGPPDGIGKSEGTVSLPKTLSLSQNYPNPFNPMTTIELAIPEGVSGKTSLAIYDTRGRRVRVLVDRSLAPGKYSFSWDGRDERGGSVQSGIYLYRLKAGDYVSTRKLVVLK